MDLDKINYLRSERFHWKEKEVAIEGVLIYH